MIPFVCVCVCVMVIRIIRNSYILGWLGDTGRENGKHRLHDKFGAVFGVYLQSYFCEKSFAIP